MRTPDPTPSPEHLAVIELLPWYVNGTLDAAERSTVEAHLAGCPLCRDELDACHKLEQAVQAQPGWAPSEGHLARLQTRIAIEAPRRVAREPAPDAGGSWLEWLRGRTAAPRWALALPAAAVLALAVVSLGRGPVAPSQPDATDFRTLTAAAPTAASPRPQLQLAFTPGVTEAELRELVQELDATLVGGPSRLGVYTLALPEGAAAAATADALRDDPRIALAVPAPGSEDAVGSAGSGP